MINIHFNTLSLQCKESKEVIDLSHQVSFFHGKVSSGKSSIARLITFALGGSLERTPAIMKELISVSLELTVNDYTVLLERSTISDTLITTTCVGNDKSLFTVSVPVSGSNVPVWADKVYNISDLIFYLADVNVIRIPANRTKDESGLVRLSLRNFLWYCYLDQNKLDSSFFRMEDGTKSRNSKEVLKYILQYSTQKIVELEEKLQQLRRQRFTETATANGLRDFLKKFGFSTEDEINFLVLETKKKLDQIVENKDNLELGYRKETHLSDKLRHEIRGLIETLNEQEQGVLDLERTIAEQEALRSELVSSKFKLAKSHTIATVFSNVEFENCPCCGTSIKNRVSSEDRCKLCFSTTGNDNVTLNEQSELIQIDLNDRIKELTNSIELHKKYLQKTQKKHSSIAKYRSELDQQLEFELKQYESVFLSNIRDTDKKVAALKERMKGLNRLKRMPQEISRLDMSAALSLKSERILKSEIDLEKQNLVKGETIIQELEEVFLTTLLEIGMPGITKEDKVVINRKTWEVMIWPKGEDYLQWNFYNAGSGGKKTLFNSCFLLAVHIIASKNDLPLPSFIIIDTPMKNIDKEVNQNIFRNFFNYLYKLAIETLDNTQFIIVDNNFIPPSPEMNLSFYDRYMDGEDPENPPLISYYVGP